MSETIEPETALTVIAPSTLPVVIAADKDNLLGALADKLKGFRADISTEHGRKAIASMARHVSSTKADLLRIADRVSEEARKTHKAIVAEKNVIEERLDALRDQVRAPLTAFEAREKSRIAAHEAALAAIPEAPSYGQTEIAAELQERLTTLENWPDRDWEEFADRAEWTLAEEKARTRRLLETAKRREAEAAELERLRAEAVERERQDAIRRQTEREAEIAAQAAQRAREEAEATARREREAAAAQAEAERQEAARRERDALAAAQAAENARIAAEQRAAEAAAQAERQRQADAAAAERRQKEALEAERRRAAAEQAEAQRQADARAADRANRATKNREALADLVAAGLSDEAAQSAVTAIAKGAVRNVKVIY